MDNLKIEYLPLEAIKPYERNARKHADVDVDAIVASIQRFGFDDPIGIWSDKNIIVEGHGRLLAAKKLGMTAVPVIRLDHLSDEERRAYALAHNKTAELSSWDVSILNTELDDLGDVMDLSELGFDTLRESAKEDDYNPEPPKEPKTKLGDIYQLGRHRLMCGDSTDPETVERLMAGREADMLLTDPPYNVDISGQEGKKILNDHMEDNSFREFLTSAFKAAVTAMRAGAAFHIWHASTEAYNFLGAARDAGLTMRQIIIWVKNSPTLGRQDFQWQHEPCLSGEVVPDDAETVDEAIYGWKEGSHSWYKKRKEKTVLFYDKPKSSKEHPTMKPITMFDYEMQCNTKKGDAVLDLFGGSGTTIIAAEQNGRDAYVMELDPAYCDVIVDRWETLTGQKAHLC